MKVKKIILIILIIAIIFISITANMFIVTAKSNTHITFATIGAGWRHSAVIKNDGSLWVWGYDYYGQQPEYEIVKSKLIPVKIMDGAKQVFAGGFYTMVIKDDGSLWAWGNNNDGQLGDGTTINRSTPVKIMDDVIQVSAGERYTMVIKSDGSLWVFGYNNNGQLGDGTKISRSNPIKIMGDVIQVSAGDEYSTAIKSDGSLWVWGRNDYGQLGDGTKINRITPVKIMDDVIQVSAGGSNTMVIKSDGSLWTWGSNDSGEIGDGTKTIYDVFWNIEIDNGKLIPVKIMENVIQISAGAEYSTAIKSDGSLWAWGSNYYGQLGDGTNINRATPVKIMDGVIQVYAGYFHTMAVKSDGSLWTWGSNSEGQIGDGTQTLYPYKSGNIINHDKYKPIKIMNNIKMPFPQNGEPIGDVLYSDITAYINGNAIPTSVINGKTLVTVEDLARYGFDVVWNKNDRTLKVELNKNKKINPLPVVKDITHKSGTFKCKYVYTDIKTYLSGEVVESFAINGVTLIDFELLAKYGSLKWDGKAREIRLVIDK